LVPFTKEAGDWQLAVLDLGTKAQRHECEFLMRFVFRTTDRQLPVARPFVEIGFALFMPAVRHPFFVLTVETAAGFPR
jgi:hypothetical protein